jgi:hypothetical protein
MPALLANSHRHPVVTLRWFASWRMHELARSVGSVHLGQQAGSRRSNSDSRGRALCEPQVAQVGGERQGRNILE